MKTDSTTGNGVATTSTATAAADNESEIYDRQIRLWGAEAQSKMTSAKVLYVNMSGVSSEILKNLILAGVQCSICDDRPYPDAILEMPSSFLPPSERTPSSSSSSEPPPTTTTTLEQPTPKKRRLTTTTTVAEAFQPHIHELNPLLPQPTISPSHHTLLPPTYFHQFDVVIASHLSLPDATRIADATTAGGGKFYLVHAFGWHACALIDLGAGHEYRKEVGKDKLSDKVIKVGDRWHKGRKPPMVWARYKAILNYYGEVGEWPGGSGVVGKSSSSKGFGEVTKKFLVREGLGEDYLGDEEELEQLANVAMAEVSPVCAVMGGVIGNEVIKVISGKGEPANNTLMFDGLDGGCRNFTIKEKKT